MDVKKAAKFSICNIKKEGLTDIFERPFEVDLLNNDAFAKKVENEICKRIGTYNVTDLSVNNLDYVLLPKNSAFNFRKCALMQPLDTLKYSTIVLSMADVIEKARIPVSKQRIFSYRFSPSNGYLFNKNYTITAFREQTSLKAQRARTKFVVSCDIANFYDRLNLHRLENSLLSINCEKKMVKLLNELLLTWSNRDSYGLPVGSNASRILAEAGLIGIDSYLMSMNVDFIRFVDDYRLFAPNAKAAHYWLTILIERLQQEGLSINMRKTNIEESQKYCKNIQETATTFPSVNQGNFSAISTKQLAIQNASTNNNATASLAITTKDGIKPAKRAIIRAGYGGTVPTRFRELSKREINNLNDEKIREVIDALKTTALITSEDFIKAVKVCIAKNEYDSLPKLLPLLEKYLQLTPYYIDAIIKNADKFSTQSIAQIKQHFTKALNSIDYTPEYLTLSYITHSPHP